MGRLIGNYDKARASLDEINSKLKLSSKSDIDSQLVLTSEKINIRKKLNAVGLKLDTLNRQIIRFSGSYLSVLPSDQFLETIKSLSGEISGGFNSPELYLSVNEMNELHRKLDIQLVGNIVNDLEF